MAGVLVPRTSTQNKPEGFNLKLLPSVRYLERGTGSESPGALSSLDVYCQCHGHGGSNLAKSRISKREGVVSPGGGVPVS